MNVRTVIAGACVGVIALTAIAYGGFWGGKGGAADDPVAAVHRAPDLTRGAGSSRWETSTTMRSSGKTIVLHGEGAYHYARSMGTLSLQMPPEAGMKEPLREVITPDALYVRGAARSLPDKWVKIDLPNLATDNLVSSGSMDPSTSLQVLHGVNADVRSRGAQVLRGVRVQRYSGTLDVRKALDQSSAEARPAFAAALRGLASTTIPFNVYLDEKGRICRLDQTMLIAARNAKGPDSVTLGPVPVPDSVRIDTVTELFDFGSPVKVQVPPAAEVVRAANQKTHQEH